MVFKNTERTGKIQALYQDIIRLFRETITEGWGAYVTVQVIITAADTIVSCGAGLTSR